MIRRLAWVCRLIEERARYRMALESIARSDGVEVSTIASRLRTVAMLALAAVEDEEWRQ